MNNGKQSQVQGSFVRLPDAVDLSARQAVLLACLHEVMGDAAAACTASTPLADWPIDPIINCRLVYRLQEEFEDVPSNAVYRYESPSEWARALRWRSSCPQAAAPVTASARASSKCLWLHGIVKKVADTFKCCFSGLGRRHLGAHSGT